jgi:hypothetical protein
VDGLGHTAAVIPDIDAAANMLSVSATGASRVGLIDGLTLTRDCLSLAFNTASPDLIVLPFTIAEECIRVTAVGIGSILPTNISHPAAQYAGSEAPMSNKIIAYELGMTESSGAPRCSGAAARRSWRRAAGRYSRL